MFELLAALLSTHKNTIFWNSLGVYSATFFLKQKAARRGRKNLHWYKMDRKVKTELYWKVEDYHDHEALT